MVTAFANFDESVDYVDSTSVNLCALNVCLHFYQ